MEENPKYTEEDIEKMYCYPDGKNHRQQTIQWKTNEYLPEGWMCSSSITLNANICVKADDNTKLTSYKAAVAYMEADPKYTKEDVTRMYCYPDGKDRKKLSQNYHSKLKLLLDDICNYTDLLNEQNNPHDRIIEEIIDKFALALSSLYKL